MKYSKTTPIYYLEYIVPGDEGRVTETEYVRGQALLRASELIDSERTSKVVLTSVEVFERLEK